jgi:simple sugar transport system substrate-binding protein
MMVTGVNAARDQAAAAKRTVDVKVIEGGFNQGDWQKGVLSLAASGEYDLIVSSNPSLPEIAAAAAKEAPKQHFLILDGFLEGNPQIKTIAYNQYEQGFLNGYWAALISSAGLPHANPDLVLGLIAGQEYPVMNNEILAGFRDGAQAVNPGFKIDFRVLGNWFDAAKASGLARDMIGAKADVILAIAGGGNQGVISAAKENGAYVSWFDSPGYAMAPDVVIGSTVVNQTASCTAAVMKAIGGTLDYGTGTRLGIKEDAVGFAFDDPAFPKAAPEAAIAAERDLIAAVKAGTRTLQPKN